MQINSGHLPALSRHGIQEADLFEPCTNIRVGAWLLADSFLGGGDVGCRRRLQRGLLATQGRRLHKGPRQYAWRVYRQLPAQGSAQLGKHWYRRRRFRPDVGEGFAMTAASCAVRYARPRRLLRCFASSCSLFRTSVPAEPPGHTGDACAVGPARLRRPGQVRAVRAPACRYAHPRRIAPWNPSQPIGREASPRPEPVAPQ